jgi:hypothetical protein
MRPLVAVDINQFAKVQFGETGSLSLDTCEPFEQQVDFWAKTLQLFAVGERKPLDYTFATTCELNKNLPTVLD